MRKDLSISYITGLLAVLGYLVFTLLAFVQYPLPYSPLENWLSDLGNTHLNPSGALFYNVGIISTALLLMVFFLGLSRWRIENNKIQNLMLVIAEVFGILGAFCMVMSAVYPINIFAIHAFWSTSLNILLSTAFVLLATTLRYHPEVPRWLLILATSTALGVILTGLLPKFYVLEWITIGFFLCFVSLVGVETKRLKIALKSG